MSATDQMDLSDLFSHLNSISSSYHTHWNFFSGVVLATVGAVALKDDLSISICVGAMLITGLSFFLFSNFKRIKQAHDEINIVQKEIQAKLQNSALGQDFIDYYHTELHSRVNKNWPYFHCIIDFFVVSVLVFKMICC